jgi:hypothetical protein
MRKKQHLQQLECIGMRKGDYVNFEGNEICFRPTIEVLVVELRNHYIIAYHLLLKALETHGKISVGLQMSFMASSFFLSSSSQVAQTHSQFCSGFHHHEISIMIYMNMPQ